MADVTHMSRGVVLQDPDMWPCMKKIFGKLVDKFFADVDREVERNLENLKQRSASSHNEMGPDGASRVWLAVRAF
eukprot:9478907-Pyramimonas_sp.AAC.1